MAWPPGKPVEMETKRFFVRSLKPEDADENYTGWWNDAEIQRGFNQPVRNWNKQRAAQHIRQFNNRNKFHLGIYCKKTGKLIGFFAIFVNDQQKTTSSNICIGDKSYWGKGVGTEITRQMVDFMFESLEVEKVEGMVKGHNLPSISIYKALGFQREALQRSHIISMEGGRTEVYLFGLLREEWLAQKK